MNGDMVIIVTGPRGKVVDSKVFKHSRYPLDDNYEKAITKQIGIFERTYKSPSYVIHQGSASTVTSFLTVYRELARK